MAAIDAGSQQHKHPAIAESLMSGKIELLSQELKLQFVAYTQLHIRGDGGLVEVDRQPHRWRSNMSFEGQGYKRPVLQQIWIEVRM